MQDVILIKGARQHNLKNINVTLPKNKLIVFTGISGSGKSSLAFDTIYAEGQRRYVESLSSYARQFLGIMDKPDVDSIEGLSPAISIDQKSTSHNPRSTVGTVTEIYDYFRLLFARVGHPHCPKCGREISNQTSQQIFLNIIKLAKAEIQLKSQKYLKLIVLSPVVRDRKGEFDGLFANLRTKGYRQVRIDSQIIGLDEDLFLIKTNKHTIEVVIDKITLDQKILLKQNSSEFSQLKLRLSQAIEQGLNLSQGLVIAGVIEDAGFNMPAKPKNIIEHIYSEHFSCPVCNLSLSEIEPRTFSFNSPHGACPGCSGLGKILMVDPELVLNPELTISEGGIFPFARMFLHDTWYSRVITTICQKNNIDIKKPLKNLTQNQRNILLYGTGLQTHLVKGTNRFGDATTIEEKYVGIIGELKNRYLHTESDFMRLEIEKYMRQIICPDCQGKKLKKESLTITVDGFSISDVTELSINDCLNWIKSLMVLNNKLSNQEQIIANPIIKEIKERLDFMVNVGLDYLTLARSANTLAGGEAQRIRLASQIGSGLSGVLYVLDEPSIGLHQRDNQKLITTLKRLRDLGNTVIVVEHDREMIEAADYIVDFGPGAGKHGGQVIFSGTINQLLNDKVSITAKYLINKRIIVCTKPDQSIENNKSTKQFTIVNASQNNLKNITASFPLGKFICVTGVSGSGKSTLVVETLYQAIYNTLNQINKEKPGDYEKLEGIEQIDKIILIDQSPIGRTPRSNPATYTGMFSYIRDLFSQLPEARLRGYKQGRFSFNVKNGRCESCEGAGLKKIEMQFLSDLYITCDVCHGRRYNSETLEILYHGKNIAQILDLTVEEGLDFFSHHGSIQTKLKTISDVGLGYMHLGQSATTLSGGEAQRVKLASELSRRATGKTLYVLDEPTTGLHFADIEKLLKVFVELTERGNTVVVIEHNLDIISNSDWIIDLGPQGGDQGGKIVATGTPKEVSKVNSSYTGQFLKRLED